MHTSGERLAEIVRRMRVVFLIGTQKRVSPWRDYDIDIWISAGWQNSSFVNKSCGVANGLSHIIFTLHAFKGVFLPKHSIIGRGLESKQKQRIFYWAAAISRQKAISTNAQICSASGYPMLLLAMETHTERQRSVE